MGHIDLIPIVLFLCIFAAVYTVQYFRSKKEESKQKTIRLMLEKGHELNPEMLEALMPARCKGKDYKTAIPLMGVGIACLIFGLFGVHESAVAWASAFPFCIGAGQLIAWKISKDKNNG